RLGLGLHGGDRRPLLHGETIPGPEVRVISLEDEPAVHRAEEAPASGVQSAAGAPVTVRILIADDQALVRAGFRMILDAEDGLDVVGEASDGGEAVTLAGQMEPDVVLM